MKTEAAGGQHFEKVFVNINGVEQGMFIKSKDVNASCAALPSWGYAGLLPYTEVPYRS